MEKRFIDRYDVILLDMGNTFMFEVDRFGPNDNLGHTYSQFGGKLLTDIQVYQTLSTIFKQMVAAGEIEANYEKIASVSDYLTRYKEPLSLSAGELSILEKVFAEHEIGVISDKYVNVLKELGSTHRIGIISDIWSKSERFYRELEKMDIKDMFDVIVFSSDIGIIKPSGKIFAKAMEGLDVDVSKMVYIGDSYRRDIVGAISFGMSAIWIRPNQVFEIGTFEPDLIINDLSDVLV